MARDSHPLVIFALFVALVPPTGQVFAGAPVTNRTVIPSEMVSLEREQQKEIILEEQEALYYRLRSIGLPILKSATTFCRSQTRQELGLFFVNKHFFPEEYQDAAIRLYDVGDYYKVIHVIPNFPADIAGLKRGDILVAINDSPIPYGKDTHQDLRSVFLSELQRERAAIVTVLRDRKKEKFEVTPVTVCDYPLALSESSEVNAYADGQRILVTYGMMRVAEADIHLATVIAHETAHNAMFHDQKRQENINRGRLVDYLAAILGVNTYGHFQQQGALKYSIEFEEEADKIGLYILAGTNYSLTDIPYVARKMAIDNPNSIWAQRRSTHPSTPERVLAMEKTVEEIQLKISNNEPVLPDIKEVYLLQDARKQRKEPEKVEKKEIGVESSEEVKPVVVSAEAKHWTEKSLQSLQSQSWVDAIRTASAAIRINPSYDIPYVNRAWAYIEKGFPHKALEDTKKALELNPTNGMAYNNQGYAYQELGDLEEAKNNYRKACELKAEAGCLNFQSLAGFRPDDINAKIAQFLGESYKAFQKQDWSSVIEISNKVIELDPDNVTAYVNRAGAFAESGKLNDALMDCEQAIRIDPDSRLAYHNKAYVLEKLGRNVDAQLEYEIACELGLKDSCLELKKHTSFEN